MLGFANEVLANVETLPLQIQTPISNHSRRDGRKVAQRDVDELCGGSQRLLVFAGGAFLGEDRTTCIELGVVHPAMNILGVARQLARHLWLGV